MADCMEHCSRFWGIGEGCFGVVWTEAKGNCWIRNSTTGTANLRPEVTAHSALVIDDEMKGVDTKCPAPDASVHDLSGVDGMGYTMNCNKVISGFDTCFSGFPKPCLDAPYRGFFHTNTMEECIRICVDQQPLCKGVSWSPDLKIGFANCWPKTGFSDGALQSPGQKQGVIHSATITRIDPVDTKCPEKKTYTSNAGKAKNNFDIKCGQVSSGSNMTMLHRQNITSCMDACASSEQKCVGVVFDSGLAGGFKNCYLQNTTNTVSDLASATYAAMSSSTSGDSSSGSGAGSGSGNSDNSSSSSSKAWIAGPVIGGIAAIALLAFLAFWWRKRKGQSAHNATIEKDGREFGSYGPAPAYSPGGAAGPSSPGAGGYYDPPPPPPVAPLTELNGDNREVRELPTTTDKYAHSHVSDQFAYPSGKSAPHELP
jgi:hypothetical protein